MTVTLDLTPELEKRILAQAVAQGLSPEDYLLSIIETAGLPPAAPRPTLEQFEAAMDAAAGGGAGGEWGGASTRRFPVWSSRET